MFLSQTIRRVFSLLLKDYFLVCPYLIFSLVTFLVSSFFKNFSGLKFFSSGNWLGLILFILIFLYEFLTQIITLKMTEVLEKGETFSLGRLFKESLKFFLAFLFASLLAYFLIFYLSMIFSFIFIASAKLMLAAFFGGVIFSSVIIFLWPAALIAERSGPLSAFRHNFGKLKNFPIEFLAVAFLGLLMQFLGLVIGFQLRTIPAYGELLMSLASGFFMALYTIVRMVGYLNLKK